MTSARPHLYTQSGRVAVRRSQEGNTSHIAYLSTGQVFGEMCMIDEKSRSATVIAIEATDV